MNEHIKALLAQSGLQPYYDAQEGQIEKFAELIVKECSNFLKDTLDDHFAAEQLEEHFGVEE
jgi:hypothetical protein